MVLPLESALLLCHLVSHQCHNHYLWKIEVKELQHYIFSNDVHVGYVSYNVVSHLTFSLFCYF